MTTYGIEKIFSDIKQLGFNVEKINNVRGVDYVVIREFMISVGKFIGKVIDLAIPVPIDYPRTCGSCIHVKSQPHLLDKRDTLSGIRNIIDSPLGDEWRYWSFRFQISHAHPTQDLISQINGIFRRIEK